jgi:hypothetical protein
LETKLKTIEDEKDVEIERLKIELANANLKPEPESSSDEEPITGFVYRTTKNIFIQLIITNCFDTR